MLQLGGEKHLKASSQGKLAIVFESPALQDLHDRYENLFQAPPGDAMILFMWQDDIIGLARFIDACLERVCTSAGPPAGDQTSDQPGVAWNICNDSSSATSTPVSPAHMPLVQAHTV